MLSTLVIWGTHGSNAKLCELGTADIEDIVRNLPKNQFVTVVLDACESALHANKVKDLLSDRGVILCHMGICQHQIMTDDEIQEDGIRNSWKNLVQAQINALHDPDIAGAIEGVFPAIYHKSEKMNCLKAEGMPYENPTTSKNPFLQKDLAKNQKTTGSNIMTDIKVFFNLLN